MACEGTSTMTASRVGSEMQDGVDLKCASAACERTSTVIVSLLEV